MKDVVPDSTEMRSLTSPWQRRCIVLLLLRNMEASLAGNLQCERRLLACRSKRRAVTGGRTENGCRRDVDKSATAAELGKRDTPPTPDRKSLRLLLGWAAYVLPRRTGQEEC